MSATGDTTGDPTAAETFFVTGFPGFLGSRLLPRILRRSPQARAACLVQPRFEALAKERVAALEAAEPALAGRIDLVSGDLTATGLGVDGGPGVAARTTEIWHLAAVYDLSVPRAVGMRVNVEGTRNVLRFAEGCPGLRRHHYVSTCYVSGRHCGPFHESDLDVGQSFNNFYEETKFLAEVEVAEARAGGLPTTVYRPAIVVGDSRTGDTQKFDGPYFLLQWLVRQPRGWALVPLVGDPTMVRFNMVPSDFVIDAIEHLSGLEVSAGRTYQLADPRPLTVDGLLTEMLRAVDRRGVRVPLPRRLTTWSLAHIPPLARFVGIPASAVEYFVHPTHYDTAQAERDLAGSGVACPPVADYLPALVRFMTEHRDADLGAMV
ncbi:MAG TPA: SDR family oxidoreductase [Acidimicrobiales bacterium]|nr:SDR family oxidoreductase [Acidimicrobiales bacterium]